MCSNREAQDSCVASKCSNRDTRQLRSTHHVFKSRDARQFDFLFFFWLFETFFFFKNWLFDFLREKWLFDFLSCFSKSYFLTFCAKSDFLTFWVVFRKVTFWLFARKVTFWLFDFLREKCIKLTFWLFDFFFSKSYSRSKAFLRRERRLVWSWAFLPMELPNITALSTSPLQPPGSLEYQA